LVGCLFVGDKVEREKREVAIMGVKKAVLVSGSVWSEFITIVIVHHLQSL
jgi:hypothetical protein